GVARAAALPDSVSLRDGIVFGTGERLVSPATHPAGREASGPVGGASWEARYRINRWWVEGDSLRLRFSDGARDEWLLWLGEEGEGLVGRGSRGRRAGPEARVRAIPIGCELG
ncbi:MAG TPA: hypothetical protein VMM35_10240, partial [Longimicrobiales bacterium]|nr:hypothetical protein [Longimicrobiales bacterium]